MSPGLTFLLCLQSEEFFFIKGQWQGNDYLFALGEKGIGAIYLGNVSTSFALKDESNQTNAQLQQTGIYLNENGTTGTIQHIDLLV